VAVSTERGEAGRDHRSLVDRHVVVIRCRQDGHGRPYAIFRRALERSNLLQLAPCDLLRDGVRHPCKFARAGRLGLRIWLRPRAGGWTCGKLATRASSGPALLGDEFDGIVGSDRFTAYNSLEPASRQVCWSHLRRDFTFHADLGLGAQEAFGLDGLEITGCVFQAWKQFREDGDRAALQERVEAIKGEMRRLLERGSKGKRQRLTRGLANNLLKLWPALWTLATIPGVEPTNNAAERALRAAVIYRMLSLGSQSDGGQRTIERLLSVDQTCRLQRRSLYAYLSDALAAKARGDPIPTLA
jgi:transposase